MARLVLPFDELSWEGRADSAAPQLPSELSSKERSKREEGLDLDGIQGIIII